jgi:hypothetical protein
MKPKSAIFFCLFLTFSTLAKGSESRPNIYVMPKADVDLAAYVDHVTSFVSSALRKEFRCASVLTQFDVRMYLAFERQRQLLGAGQDSDLEAIAGAMGATEYILTVEVSPDASNRLLISLSIMKMASAKTLVRKQDISQGGLNTLFATANKVIEKFVEELAYYELCPYKGTITMTRRSTRKRDDVHETPEFCQGFPAVARLTSQTYAEKDTVWRIQKLGKQAATGTADLQTFEEISETEEYNCYPCSSGRMRPRIGNKTITSRGKIEGLSSESSHPEFGVKDVRARVVFKEGGTYSLGVSAASAKGTVNRRTVEKAEGCDPISKNDNKDASIDVPLEEIAGPFQGAPTDRVLADSKEYSYSKGDENITIKVEFRLTRD